MPERGGYDDTSNLCQCNSQQNTAILTCEEDKVKFVVRQ